jgi:hypothetical protein|tara:strand:- start:13473 stop:13871 length:399 start_codon:yes stop_codon:yes gene_type:complete
LFIRNLTILLFLASCSATSLNFENIKFDDSFVNIEKYELKKCLNNVTEEINLSSFDFKLTAENITSQGLEFNTKYVGSLTLEVSSLDKLIPIQKMRMNTTNYISSNMADEEKKRIKSLMLIDICETIKTHVN